MLTESKEINEVGNALHKKLIMEDTNLTEDEDKLVMVALEHLEDYAALVAEMRLTKVSDLF